MELVVLGLNHKTAPVEVRERLAFSSYSPEIYLEKLGFQSSVQGGLVLSTCNRVEVYATGNKINDLLHDAALFLRSFHHLSENEIAPYLYQRTNRDAVQHIFRVASSLDSMVVGEPQILGQVKEAYYSASASKLTNPFFDLLMQKTFSVAKRVRTETSVSQQAVSISYAAVELALKIFGELKDKSALILGAGEMAEQSARHLRKKDIKDIVFSNRSYEHSVDLAKEYKGIPIPFDEFPKYIPKTDIVIVSTAAPYYLIHKADVEKWVESRVQEPIFFIDISVPRNVEPNVHKIENVFLYNVDDLQKVVSDNLRAREQEAKKAEEIISNEVNQFYRTAGKLEFSPMILELQQKYEQVFREELARLETRLKGMEMSERAEVERSFETVVRKILNDPILFLKGELGESDKNRAEILKEVFRLTAKGEWEDEE